MPPAPRRRTSRYGPAPRGSDGPRAGPPGGIASPGLPGAASPAVMAGAMASSEPGGALTNGERTRLRDAGQGTATVIPVGGAEPRATSAGPTSARPILRVTRSPGRNRP